MKKRSIRQIKSDLSRINLDNKSLKQGQSIIAKQYNKLGKVVPQKIINGTATVKDLNRYMTTLTNAVDKQVQRQEQAREKLMVNTVNKKLKTLNTIQNKRFNAVNTLLKGYSPSFVKGFASGSVAVLGRDITFGMVHTKEYNKEQVEKLARFNNKTPSQWLDVKIKALRKDLQRMEQLATPKEQNSLINQALSEIEELLEINNITLSGSNRAKIIRKLNNLDFLGIQKTIKIMQIKQDNSYYEIYKQDLTHDRNRELVNVIINDINKSTHRRLTENVRLLE